MSPTARTLAECRKRGWIPQIVEQTIPRTFIKRDFLGVIDVIAVTPSEIIGIQVTSGSNHAARVTKALAEPRLVAWLRAGGKFAVWSYSKRKHGKSARWTLREEEAVLK